MQCPKCSSALESVLSKAGVMLDVCVSCKGVWLDQGEISFFVKDAKLLEPYSRQGLFESKPVLLQCPRCRVRLNGGKIPGFKYEVEECPSCQGLWLDEHEFAKIGELGKFETFGQRKFRKVQMPSLAFTSVWVLGSLYALLFGLVVFVVEAGKIPYPSGVGILLGFIALQFLIGPWLMDWSLRLFGSLNWVSYDQLPEHLERFIRGVCERKNIPLPQFGIIEDGSPQAYTYGRTPMSARLVISRGILDILTPEEVEAVVAHELGHIFHWDFVIMTLAQLVPVLLYHLYRICSDLSRGKSEGKDDPRSYLKIAAIVAYIFYFISHYLVRFISRVREYWADQFSVYTTRNPNALIWALTKIAYGLVANQKDSSNEGSNEKKQVAVQAMGIMNVAYSKEMALYASQGLKSGSQDLKEIMQWDLWSPWAVYYELHSTHPLTAKRINAIAAHAMNLGVEPSVIFDLKRPQSYWDDFFRDLIVVCLPWIGGLAGVALSYVRHPGPSPSYIIMGVCLGGLAKVLISYPSGPFLESSVVALLKKIKVSPVTSYPVTIRGKVMGRGTAGYIFSEDMMVRDKSGMIFLDFQHGIANWYFSLFKIRDYIGQEVTLEGWYRRAPIPYIELKTIRTATSFSRSYGYYYQLLFWLIGPIILAAIALFK